jgi:hypothetical protein
MALLTVGDPYVVVAVPSAVALALVGALAYRVKKRSSKKR